MAFLQLVPASDRSRTPASDELARHAFHRAREVPATAIPPEKERRRVGSIISIALHVALLLFLIADPPLNTDPNLKELDLGAGGAGPRGGGGGGRNGSGGIRYVNVAPPPKPVVPTIAPKPELVIVPPKLPEPEIPQLDIPKLAPPAQIEVKIQSPIVGMGGGTGHDGTNGNGPGTGGGVGSGTGTGRGSGVGPGTGGGNGTVYPPSPKEFFIPPLPIPDAVKCAKLIADFDVDEQGRVLGKVKFTPTKNGGYNRKLEQQLNEIRWKPGTTLDGVPVRALGQIIYQFGC